MTHTRLKFADHTSWLNARKEGIGASEVATVLGLNPYETPRQLWREKLGIDAPKAENFFMKAGHYLEDAVAKFYADASGNEIIASSAEEFMFMDKDRPFLRVSPDRTYWLPDMVHNDDNKGILECKTTQRTIDPDDLPKPWFCQLQMNLGVAGYEKGALAWLSCGRDFGYKSILFDPDFYGWMTEEVERFWKDYVLTKKEPDALNVNDIVEQYSSHTAGKQIEVGDDIFAAYKDLKDVRKQLDALEERKTLLEDKMKMVFEDAEAITYGGETLATWKKSKDSEKFDVKKFQEENPRIAKDYTYIAPGSRRFVLK